MRIIKDVPLYLVAGSIAVGAIIGVLLGLLWIVVNYGKTLTIVTGVLIVSAMVLQLGHDIVEAWRKR